jgi:MFS family permease
MLNAIYSLPNVVLILVGGVLVDRFGAGIVMVVSGGIMLLGALLTSFAPDFTSMAAGRLLFGIGAETNNISTLAAVATYFAGGNLAFAMGLALAIGRAGSFSADMSPTWFADAYAGGWQPPLEIAAVIMALSFATAMIYLQVDRRLRPATPAGAPGRSERTRFDFRDLLKFGTAYWYLLILCVLWYAVILAFRSTFSIKYFQHAHGLDLATAGAMNSYVFLAAMFATPAFGWLCDRLGRYAPMLAFGAALLPVAMLIMASTQWSLWVATALIGISYSLVPAVMWPLLSKIVRPGQFGTALGLMWVVQNAGIAAGNLIAGSLNDAAGASATNPAGYQSMMAFFGLTSAAGLVFALLLWHRAGRRAHDKVVPGAALDWR